MSLYLLDTDVLSNAAPGRARRSQELTDWMDAHSADLFLSSVTVAEVCSGIAKLKREGAVAKAANIAAWLELILHLYGDRVLAFDTPAARLAGKLMDKARGAGSSPGFADIAIAATAGSRGMTILTRNLRHFAPLGISAIDPFCTLP